MQMMRPANCAVSSRLKPEVILIEGIVIIIDSVLIAQLQTLVGDRLELLPIELFSLLSSALVGKINM